MKFSLDLDRGWIKKKYFSAKLNVVLFCQAYNNSLGLQVIVFIIVNTCGALLEAA